MANRRFIDFPIAASVGDNDIVLIWQDGLNKQTTKATLLQGSPQSLAGLTDVDIAALTNGQILQYNSTTSKWENVDRTDINLSELGDVTIVAPANGQVLVYNSSTGKWENSSAGYVPYTGAVTTVNLGAQTIQAGSFVKAGGTSAQFLKADGSVDSSTYGTGTVTSVALTMPTAFSVAGSPITTAGTLAVTGAGLVSQYIRGDGSLADFPATTGGGSSVSYYLNGSVSQGTIGGVAYKELNKTPIFGAGTDITISADGYIASFITDAGDPNKLLIPAGNWNLETFFSASSNGGSPSFYVELYKYNGTTFTLIATSSSAPELIAFGTNLNPYFSTLAVPETVLALTDRLALRYYVNTSGRTITLHTENNHLCQVITTFTTGLTALNGLTSQVQFFAVGSAGTDFAISSASDTHTFNLPTASATNRGALSSGDWTTFNNKTSNLGTVTSVGLSSATSGVTIGSTPITTSGTITLAIATASGSQNGLLSSTDWTTFNGKQNALTNPVTGTGASGQVAYFTGTSAISSESNLFWDATNDRLGIGTNTPDSGLQISSGGTRGIRVDVNSGVQAISISPNGIFGIDEPGEGNKRFAVNTSGRVLIGTTTDNGARLQVSGTANISGSIQAATESNIVGSSVNARILVTASGVANTVVGFNNSGSTTTGVINNAAYFGVLQAYPLVFTTDSLERLRIASTGASTFSSANQSQNAVFNSTGNVLITSTASPSVNNGGSLSLGGRYWTESNTIATFGRIHGKKENSIDGGTAGYLSFETTLDATAFLSEKMRITSLGNVGIGTSSPAYALDIQSGSGALGISLRGRSSDDISLFTFFNNAANTQLAKFTAASTYLGIDVGGTERMRITSNGFTKSSNNGTYMSTGGFHELRTNLGNVISYNTNSSNDPYGHLIEFTAASPNNTTNYFLYCGDSTQGKFAVFSNGDVDSRTNSYGGWSDIKLKENIVDASPKLKDLLKVKIKNYNFIGDNKKQLGVIAQELEEIFPSLVTETPDFKEVEVPQLDNEGNEILNEKGEIITNKEKQFTGTTTKSVKYSIFVPMLIKAIQELKQEIDTLKN
jgi:hypothetical protein